MEPTPIGIERECEFCHEVKPCTFMPDPYGHDVNNDDTLYWICEDCAVTRADEI